MVGLGNPGARYAMTRHNVGADAVIAWASRHGASLRSEKGVRASMARVRIGTDLVVAAVPETYMNESGLTVALLLRRFEVDDVSDVVVVHDEMDLPVGRVKLKKGGGTAGHNGLKSIQSHLHTSEFSRVRIGIGRPPGRQPAADYVLSKFLANEQPLIDVALARVVESIEVIGERGMETTMNVVNQAPQDTGDAPSTASPAP